MTLYCCPTMVTMIKMPHSQFTVTLTKQIDNKFQVLPYSSKELPQNLIRVPVNFLKYIIVVDACLLYCST